MPITPEKMRLQRQMLAAMEERILSGQGVSQISKEMGLSAHRTKSLMRMVQKRWAGESPEELEAKRATAMRRLENVASHALEAFEKSREDKVSITIQKRPETCKACGGTGADGECPVCEGSGKVVHEIITKDRVGQAGDSSMLQVARQCWEGIAKLQGLQPKTPAGTNIGVLVMDNQTLEKFRSLDADTLLALRNQQQRAIRGNKERGPKQTGSDCVIEGTLSDPKSDK